MGLIGLVGVHSAALAATFYVDANTGDDSRTAAQAQAAGTPWKTLTKATTDGSVAAGDTITVAAGTYDEALGELFPVSLLDGVAFHGAGAGTVVKSVDTTVFQYTGGALSSGSELVGFNLDSEAAVTGLYLSGLTGPSSPLITNNTFSSNLSRGVSLSQSTGAVGSFSGSVADNTFDAQDYGFTSFWAGAGDFTPHVDSNMFGASGTSLFLQRDEAGSGALVSPLVTNNTFSGTDGTAMSFRFSSVYGSSTFTPIVVGNDVEMVDGDGLYMGTVYVYADATAGVTVANNTFTGTSRGVEIYISSVSSEASLTGDYTVSGNTITGATSRPISISMSSMNDGGTVDLNFLVANNTITDSARTAISFSASSMSYLDGSLDVTVSGNTISGTQGSGIDVEISSLSQATLDLNVTVSGNTITDAQYDGIYLYGSSMSSLNSNNWEVSDNVVTGAGYYGLDIQLYNAEIGGARVSRNVLTGNGYAVYVDGAGALIDFGGGALSSIGHNDFSGSTSEFDFENGQLDTVVAHDNHWGSVVASEIDARIDDDEEDTGNNTGMVDFGTGLAAVGDRTATVTVTSSILTDAAPAGASPGDVIRYTAVASATADLGCAAPELTGTIPDTTTYVADSVTSDSSVSVPLVGDVHLGLGAIAPGAPVTMTWDVTVGEGVGCEEIAAIATLKCAPLSDIESAPATDIRVGVEEIANDGIDQDCSGADLVEDTDVAGDTDNGGGGDDTDITTTKAKCGCDDASSVGGAWLAGLAAVAMSRRRRNR